MGIFNIIHNQRQIRKKYKLHASFIEKKYFGFQDLYAKEKLPI